MKNCRVFEFCFVIFLVLFLISSIFALPCDINESNRVDGFDLILFSRVKGATPASPQWLPEADINNDKIIDEKDLEILTKHFARRGIVSSLWVADYNGNKIVKLSGATGKELLRLGGFLNPCALGTNPWDGSCWIADYGNNRVIKLDNQGKELLKIIGFNKPQCVAINCRDGSCMVGDYDKVTRLSFDGEILFQAGGFLNPKSLGIDLLDGSCWIADYDHNQVVKLSINGMEVIRKGGFSKPISVSVDQKDGSCWIADQNNNQIVKLISTGTTELLRIGGFSQPCFVSVNSIDESLWIADYYNNQLVRLDRNGSELVRVGGFNRPVSVVADPFDGGCWVADYEKNQVVKLFPCGKELKRLSGFNHPRWVALIPEEIKSDAPQVNVSEDRNHIDIGDGVNFDIAGYDVNGVIEEFELDFNGDGIFDSSLDSSGSVIHVYESGGVYNPVVKARDDSWLINYNYKNIIRVGKLTVEARASPVSGKAPLVVNFSSQLFDPIDGRVENYQWDFDGDGIYEFLSTVSGITSCTYKNLGMHQAVLKVTDTDGATTTDSITITVSGSLPKAKASANPSVGSRPLSVNFSSSGSSDSDGFIVFYQWDFDGDSTFDLNSTSGGEVTYTYNMEGIYKPLLKITDNSGLTDSFYSTVTVKQASAEPGKPSAEAICSPSFGLAPLTVLFSGIGSDSDGQIVKYEWDFGDKTYFSSDSTGMINHTYGSTGVYKAIFKITDNSRLYSTTNLLIKAQAKPISFLNANVNQGNAPLEVSFNGSGSDPDGRIVKYELDFEGDDVCDLSSTTNVSVNHIYPISGVYNPILKITDDDGYFNTAGIMIAVDRSFPAVQLKVTPQKGSAPLSVSFTANSFDRDGFVTLYEWDFDGDDVYENSSSFDSSIYVYDSIGNYKARVKVTDNDGLTAVSLVDVVVNPTGSPEAKISASPMAGSIPLDVYFGGKGTDLDGEITKYEFDFNGDGVYETSYSTFGASDSVKCVYDTARIYLAGLKVTDDDGLAGYDSIRIFVSSASLWVADHYNNKVVKLGINGKELKRLGGFNRPYTVSVNVVDGSCWVADVVNSQIVKLNSVGQELLRVGGFNRPSWVSVNSCDGSCWIADESNHKVVKLDTDGHELFRIGGFYYPHAVSVNTSDGNCWIADTQHSQIVKLSSSGVELKRISGFNAPMDVCVDSYDGGCWANSGRIVKLDSTGQELLRIVGFNSSYGRLVVNQVDGNCWIADRNNSRIVRVDRFGKGIVAMGGFNSPEAVSPDIDGGCWVGDTYGGRVVKLSANGTKLYETKGFNLPTSVSFSPGAVGLNLQSVEANVAPSNGDIPLTVSFSGIGADTNTAITSYEWDFEGDGIYDHFSSTAEGASILHTYSSTGIYNPILRIINNNGLSGFDYRNIVRVGPASINVSLSTAGGKAPLKVDFTVFVFNPNGLVTKYEWDFQGDGIYDWNSLTTGNTNYTYSKMGKYQPVIRITDQTSEEFVKCIPEIIVTQSSPIATLSVSPTSGVRPLSVLFKMNASYDLDGSITLYELDYNNDGVYDWSNKAPDEFGYIYNLTGIYNPTLRVTDNDGLFSTTKVLVTVNPVPVTVNVCASPSVGKPPLNVSFSGAAKSDYPIILYEWNFGDGNKDSTAIIDHTYNSTGSYRAIFKAIDSAGVYATVSVAITVLSQNAPTAVVDVSPTLGDTPLNVNFNGSGTDEDGQIVKYEWDFDGNGTYDWNSNTTGVTSYTYNTVGAYNATFKVTDDSGLADTTKISIFAGSAPAAYPEAYPVSGQVPLTVTFTFNGFDQDGTIIKYEWDFDGNGIYDYSRTIPDKTTYTYKIPGTYKVRLKVTDDNNLIGTGEILIRVNAPSIPQIQAIANPSQGAVPLTVSFSGLATDLDGTIKKFEWDFHGDGLYDWASDSSAVASYNYGSVGIYKAGLKVVDNDGNSNTAFVTINVTESKPPEITVNAGPTNGDAPLKVSFTVLAVDTTSQITKYEWDFNNDGVFDFSSSTTGDTFYTYTLAGGYSASIRVTNNNNVSAIKTVFISVNMGITTTLSHGGFDPTLGEIIAINSVLTQPAKITLRIVDRNQNPVRTMVSNVDRDAGFYSDGWNGKDDIGNFVKVGVYYFIIDYEVNGKSYTYNLTNTSGNYEVSSFTYPVSFSPYDGKLCTMQYTLDKSAEITIYVWWSPGGMPAYRVKTIYLREPQKAGTYIAVWDGTNDEGIVSPSQLYVFSILKWALAKNAIIVYGRPIISDISLSTGYFSPCPDLKNNVRINFRLSKPAKLKVLVRDDIGNFINETEIPNVENGLQNIGWNGINKNGYLVTSGRYSLGIQAIDVAGNQSNWVYGVLKVFY